MLKRSLSICTNGWLLILSYVQKKLFGEGSTRIWTSDLIYLKWESYCKAIFKDERLYTVKLSDCVFRSLQEWVYIQKRSPRILVRLITFIHLFAYPNYEKGPWTSMKESQVVWGRNWNNPCKTMEMFQLLSFFSFCYNLKSHNSNRIKANRVWKGVEAWQIGKQVDG